MQLIIIQIIYIFFKFFHCITLFLRRLLLLIIIKNGICKFTYFFISCINIYFVASSFRFSRHCSHTQDPINMLFLMNIIVCRRLLCKLFFILLVIKTLFIIHVRFCQCSMTSKIVILINFIVITMLFLN